MPDRYVILHHRQVQGEHWDLMLERGGVLWTWRLDRDPTVQAHFPIHAGRIADHRLHYLTFEGPISGDRGTVRRIDAGTYTILQDSPNGLIARFEGGHVSGEFSISQAASGEIQFGPWKETERRP